MNLGEFTLVFVGCGGTFWAGANTFAALLRAYSVGNVICTDPDSVTRENQERQWTAAGVGRPKAELAVETLGRGTAISTNFQAGDLPFGVPVIVVTNPDNHDCRLGVAYALAARRGLGIQVVSGCELDHGEVYTGAWEDGRIIHEWRYFHPDVTYADRGARPSPQDREACGGQDIRANSLTGMLVGLALEEVLSGVSRPFWRMEFTEWYWRDATDPLTSPALLWKKVRPATERGRDVEDWESGYLRGATRRV
jgi:hypothetical protein